MNRTFSPVWILKAFAKIIPYLGVTIGIMVGVIVCGLLIALLLVKGTVSKRKLPRVLAFGYIAIMRCTPAIVLLFIVFYGVPKLLLTAFGININFLPKAVAVITALSLLYASSLAEIIRSAYLSVNKGQYEAAVSIGLSRFQALYRIVAPQAFVIALPNLGNSLISLLKEGSLAYTIGLIDSMGAGNIMISLNYGGYALETYLALAIIYWMLTFIIEKAFAQLENVHSNGIRNGH
ncbi:MAG: amino acid ABC transporter permease [Treponema sp.]|nr:amino acid ABC transporter permease [Treponema sp.]